MKLERHSVSHLANWTMGDVLTIRPVNFRLSSACVLPAFLLSTVLTEVSASDNEQHYYIMPAKAIILQN